MSVPWAYTRRMLARAWGVPPWVVDDADLREIALELQLSTIEDECKPEK